MASGLAERWRTVANRFHARLAGLARPATELVRRPEPRGLGEPERGRRLLAGQVLLGGYTLVLHRGESLFSRPTLRPEFEAEAQAFGWLDDLATLDGATPRTLAQNWTFDWIRRFGHGSGPGWQPGITGARVRRCIDHASFLLSGRDATAAALLYRSLARQMLFLARRWKAAPPGRPRFEALAGVVIAGLALRGMARRAAAGALALGEECRREIDPDGGIASRNPEELAEILALLTSCAEALTGAGQPVAPEHSAAIARIAPTLRALRHSDGGLARFHGGGSGDRERTERALAAAGVRTGIAALAMGYARATHGRTSLILDAAAPPQGAAAATAHASTLAFELTSGRRPLVVNCGSGRSFGAAWLRAGRVTAGHSTLEIVGLSSSSLIRGRDGAELLVDPPRDLRLQRTTDEEGTELLAAHDGYVRSHGLTHTRRLEFHANGRVLSGEDTLAAVNPDHQRQLSVALAATGGRGIPFAIRFHLHPQVEAEHEGSAVRLWLRSGETWLFRHDGEADLSLESSVWLEPEAAQPVATRQVVLTALAIDYASRVRWSLAKAGDVPVAIRDLEPDIPPQ